MKRREFISVASFGAAAVGAAGSLQATDQSQWLQVKPLKMHVGTQRSPTNPQMLQYIKRHGVDHVCGYPPRRARLLDG